MNKRHQLRHIAMSHDQPIIDITRMRGRVPNSVETGQLRQPAHKITQAPISSIRPLSVIGVYILTKKSDLAHPRARGVARFGDDLDHRTRVFSAARIGHHAKVAKLVTSFLNGEKGGHTSRGGRYRQVVEFRFRGEIRGDDSVAAIA